MELLSLLAWDFKAAKETLKKAYAAHDNDSLRAELHRVSGGLSYLTLPQVNKAMLKYTLTFKSKELQKIYMKSLVDELKVANDSDLDSYLFGPLSIGYQGTGKNLLEPESKQVIIDYLKEVRYKYTEQGIKANADDFHRATTAPYYFELIKNMCI